MAFDDPVPSVPAEVLAIRRHPAFPDAMRALAAAMLALSDSDRRLAAMFKDAGRYVAALGAAALRDEGVTLPRLKAMCARFGLLSAGRAHALLVYMHWLGYVNLWPGRDGRGPARWTLTDSFVADWRRHLAGALDAAALIDPVAADVRDRIAGDAALDLFNRAHLDQLVDATAMLAQVDGVMSAFINRDAGTQVLWALLTADGGEACPPDGPIRPGIERLAARFGVSVTHLKRMLRDARARGLLDDAGRGEIRLTATGREQLANLYAAQFVRLLAACRAVIDAATPSPATARSATSR